MAIRIVVVSVARQGAGFSVIGFDGSGFVRLLRATADGLLTREQILMIGETEARPADLVEVEAPWADARPGYREGRIVDDSRWRLLERPAGKRWLQALEQLPVAEGAIFGGPGRSVRETWDGPSVAWVEADSPAAACLWDPEREKYLPRLRFMAAGLRYELPLTDVWACDRLLRRGEGEFGLRDIGYRAPHGLRLLLSLGETFRGFRYKFVAGIWPRRTVTLWRYGTTPTLSLPRRNAVDRSLEYTRPDLGGA